MRDEGKKQMVFSRRSVLLAGIGASMFTALYCRLFQLQVLESAKYKIMSSKNKLRLNVIAAPRGKIYDKDKEVLADSQNYSRLVIDDRNIKVIMGVISQLNEGVLHNPITLTEEEVKKIVKNTPSHSAVTIIPDIAWDDLIKLEFHGYKFDNIRIEHATRRFYSYKDLYAHAIGYVGLPSEDKIKRSGVANYQDFMIGKNGLEKEYNEDITGVAGTKESEVNATGKVVRKISDIPSVTGQPLYTGLNHGLQQEVAKQFVGKNGGCVVLDIKTGQILSMYSSPTFDPNVFVSGITLDYWNDLLTSPEKPLINKAISGSFPPGSTFKPVTALAALIAGVNPSKTIHCDGAHKIGSHTFHCFKRSGHGDVDMRTAIAQSCNVYFYKAGQIAGIDNIAQAAHILGLGSATGIDLPFETSGLIPTKEWKKKRFKQDWRNGDTANTSIGQGYVLVTPIQLAVMIARIASGLNVTPSMKIRDEIFEPLNVDPHYLSILREGMYRGLNDPTGNNYRNRIDNDTFLLSGKTGTAQVASLSRSKGRSSLDEHGLFIGFAPYDNPKYAIATIVEHGVWGATSALPVSRNIMLYLAGLQ